MSRGNLRKKLIQKFETIFIRTLCLISSPKLMALFSVLSYLYMKYYMYMTIYLLPLGRKKGFPVAQLVKNPPAMQKTPVQSLGREDLLEKG